MNLQIKKSTAVESTTPDIKVVEEPKVATATAKTKKRRCITPTET